MILLTDDDIEVIMTLAREITDTKIDREKHSIIIQNVAARILHFKFPDLIRYLEFVNDSPEEMNRLISALTIHTTSWFREAASYERFYEVYRERASRLTSPKTYSFLSLGCSTGEEVYSFAFFLEQIRKMFPHFEYTLEGCDIDPVSLAVARKGAYDLAHLAQVPALYQHFFNNCARREKLFTLPEAILSRCRFRAMNIMHPQENSQVYDFISCRNLLIYFSQSQINAAMSWITEHLLLGGYFCSGISESTSICNRQLKRISSGFFVKSDSHVTGSTNDLMRSTQTHFPTSHGGSSFFPQLVAIGASTGGAEVLITLLSNLPSHCPPVLAVLHITKEFAEEFARRLAQRSCLVLGEMRDGELLRPGHIYVPLGDYHIGVRRGSEGLRLIVSQSSPLHSHRPSVDFLFSSIAAATVKSFGALLTGMGCDGAAGLLKLRNTGSITCAQDEATCTVFGMPKEAIKLNAALYIANPRQIRVHLNEALSAKSSARDPKRRA